MKCEQCSGTSFEKLPDNSYKCKYCGYVMLPQELKWFQPEQLNQKPSYAPTTNKKILTFVVVPFIILASLMVVVLTKKTSVKGKNHYTPITNKPIQPIEAKPQETQEFKEVETVENPTGEFYNISQIPDSIGNVYFMGMYKNTGKVPMNKPKVVITLYTKDGKKVAQSHGYGVPDNLLPNEETPVIVLFSRVPKYDDYKAEHNPEKPYSFDSLGRLKMKFQNVKLAPGKYNGMEVHGEIKNIDSKHAKYISIVTVLLDANKKIVGSGSGYISQDALKPDDYSPFQIQITTVIGKPVSFILDYSCIKGD